MVLRRTRLSEVVRLALAVCLVCVAMLLPAPVVHASTMPEVTVSISGPSVDRLGGAVQFTAIVGNSADKAVMWEVNGVAGGSASSGWISSSGLYTAPFALPATNPVRIGAVTAASPAVSATVALTLQGGASSGGGGSLPVAMASAQQQVVAHPLTSSAHVLTFTQSPSIVRLFGSAQFNTFVTNLGDQHATFEVNGVPGGTAATGTITPAGFYSPPLVVPAMNTVQITAISTSDSSAFATVPLVIENPMPVLLTTSIPVAKPDPAGTNILLTVMGDQSFLAGTGFLPSSVILVNNVPVPTTYVAQNQVTANLGPVSGVQTLSVAVMNPDPGGSTSAAQTISVWGTFPSGPSVVRAGATAQFSAIVQNPPGAGQNPNVYWLVNGVPNGSAITGTISSTGLYTAPKVIPSPGTMTISATSVARSNWTGVLPLTIENALPVVSGGTAIQNGPGTGVVLDVIGTGFGMGATIDVNGSPVATNWLSPTELSATVGPETGATSLLIAVTNQDPGGATSNSLPITITRYGASIAAATRLLDQATFGPTLSMNDVKSVQTLGLKGYLDQQFAMPPTLEPDWSAHADCGLNTQLEESEWWQASLTAPDQLRQRVAFALSQILVVSAVPGGPQAEGGYEITYANMLAKDAFGNFRTLLYDVTVSLAMSSYLDLLNSGKPISATATTAAQNANQNYARELMRLFTIGLVELNLDGTPKVDSSGNQIPTFNGTIVDGFARAFTGWTWPDKYNKTPLQFPNWSVNRDGNENLLPFDGQHDLGSKTLLNGVVIPATTSAAGSAMADMNTALDNVFNHPNVGPFVGRQLIQKLVTGNPSPAYVARVAAVFNNNGKGVRGDLKAVVEAILLDPEARAGDTNPSTPAGHLRDTLLYTTNVLRGLGATPTPQDGVFNCYGAISQFSTLVDEIPYYAPSVFYFYAPGNDVHYKDSHNNDVVLNEPEFATENTGSFISRMSLADALVTTQNNDQFGGEPKIDLSGSSPLGQLATTPDDLLGALSVIFMHGQMPSEMYQTIKGIITPMADPAQRARVAVYLVITSAQYKTMH